MKYTIDAAGKKLGRVASQAAAMLRGKSRADFSRNSAQDIMVEIINASQLSFSEKKGKETTFKRYSGYPGGLKSLTLQEFVTRKGYGELLRKSVLGMLPKNRMRRKIIKQLQVKN